MLFLKENFKYLKSDFSHPNISEHWEDSITLAIYSNFILKFHALMSLHIVLYGFNAWDMLAKTKLNENDLFNYLYYFANRSDFTWEIYGKIISHLKLFKWIQTYLSAGRWESLLFIKISAEKMQTELWFNERHYSTFSHNNLFFWSFFSLLKRLIKLYIK